MERIELLESLLREARRQLLALGEDALPARIEEALVAGEVTWRVNREERLMQASVNGAELQVRQPHPEFPNLWTWVVRFDGIPTKGSCNCREAAMSKALAIAWSRSDRSDLVMMARHRPKAVTPIESPPATPE